MVKYAKSYEPGRNVMGNIETEDHKELPCQDTRRILAIMGALPIALSPPYLPSRSLTKSSMVYCVVVYSVLAYDVICSAAREKRLYDEETTDTLRNRHLEHILVMAPAILGLYFWMDVPALNYTFEKYTDLQVKFRAATGKPLRNRRKWRERYSYFVVVSILCFLFAAINMISPPNFRFSFLTVLAYLYGNILAICATYVWVGLSWGIHDAAESTKVEFRKQLPSVTSSRVYEFRLLWLSMRDTLDSMGSFQCTAAMYSFSLFVAVFLLYTGAVLVQSGEVIPACGHLVFAGYYVILVALTCTATQEVQEEIVMLFLIESSRPASANFHGYNTVNKNLILSFFSNISTYIIVMVQFNQNGEGFGV